MGEARATGGREGFDAAAAAFRVALLVLCRAGTHEGRYAEVLNEATDGLAAALAGLDRPATRRAVTRSIAEALELEVEKRRSAGEAFAAGLPGGRA